MKLLENRMSRMDIDPKANGNGKPKTTQAVTIPPPNFRVAAFKIVGNAPYVQNKFSKKSRDQMHERHAAGQQGANKKKREAKDFKRQYEECQHRGPKGEYGIPASAFRSALIDACRVADTKMTMAKMTVFALADFTDRDDGSPLVKIIKGQPEYLESTVRNDSGVPDLRPRAMWKAGWEAVVRIQFDADQFTLQDVSNLMMRAGIQVGIGEGRPYSKDSHGMGWGTFLVESK